MDGSMVFKTNGRKWREYLPELIEHNRNFPPVPPKPLTETEINHINLTVENMMDLHS